MKCPKCQGELHEMTVEGVALDFCSSCKGMWFDEDEMAFLTELPSDLPEPEVTRGAAATACTCPRCQTARPTPRSGLRCHWRSAPRCGWP